ncbi:MAG: RluA family pseudouridine synthase [Candidatus Saccharibacteria bacterium]
MLVLEAPNERLDQYVAEQVTGISRASAAKLVSSGRVKVNGVAVLKPAYRVKFGDKVDVDFALTELADIPTIELPILYEDDDCVVIDKPIGLLTHSKGTFNPEPTVATWLAQRCPAMTGDRAGIVHRLDRATDGVMIVAKNPAALSWLQKQFSERLVKKTYMALVLGVMKNPEAIIDMPIERNPKKPQTFRVGSNGKIATTHYKVISTNETYSLLKLMPTTGRTHQLRVHLHQLEHPIVGDTFYEGRPAARLFLHALALEITLPNKQRHTFTADLPAAFGQLIDPS